MKTNYSKLFMYVCMYVCSVLTANAQMKYFTYPNKRIDFTGASPTVSTISSITASNASTTGTVLADAAYDENGNLLFYVEDFGVYNAVGTKIGTLPKYYNSNSSPSNPYGYGPISNKQVIIIPEIGTCRKYIIYYSLSNFGLGQTPNSSNQLSSARVDCSAATPVFSYDKIPAPNGYNPISGVYDNPVLLDLGGYLSGIVVSKLRANNTRFLYNVSNGKIDQFTISSIGITLTQSYSLPGAHQMAELELYENGSTMFLAWVEDFTLYKVIINSTTGNVSGTNSPISLGYSGLTKVYGFEINPAAPTYGYLCTNLGIYKQNITSAPDYLLVSSSSTYSQSNIEYAKDGFMYAVSNTGSFGKINTTTNTIATAGIAITPTQTPIVPNATLAYLLPNQIDGENYNYFFGVAQAIPSFQINSTTVNCATSTLFYNCNAITLNNNSTGSAQYQITITPTNAAGAATGGAIYTSAWLATCPTDLKNLPGTNGTWLSNHVGYFKISILEKNSCNIQTAPYCIFIRIATTPGPTENLTVYGKNNTNYNPSQNIASPILVGCYSLGMSIGTGGLGTANNITGYQFKIEEVNCSSGAVLSVLYNGTTIPVTTSGLIPFVGFNQTTINGSQGYFGGNCNSIMGKCYKLTLVVSNPCGTATDWTYFKIDNPGFYRIANPNNNADEIIVKNNFSLAPNPFNNKFSVQYYLEENKNVSIQLFDFTGKEVLNLKDEAWNEKGNHSIDINTDNLPKGMYIYRINTDELRIGKIIKAD